MNNYYIEVLMNTENLREGDKIYTSKGYYKMIYINKNYEDKKVYIALNSEAIKHFELPFETQVKVKIELEEN